jgi:hypothetical protein
MAVDEVSAQGWKAVGAAVGSVVLRRLSLEERCGTHAGYVCVVTAPANGAVRRASFSCLTQNADFRSDRAERAGVSSSHADSDWYDPG